MITLLDLNLRFGLAGDRGPRSWDRRKTALPELFAAVNADFLCFQEVNDFQAAELAELLPDCQVIGRRTPAPPFWQNNLIFYHKSWECRRWDRFFLSPTPDHPSRFRDSRWPRQGTLGVFSRSATRLVCGTTHFDFRAGTQLRDARVFLERLARLSAPDTALPTMIAGDFNATPDSPTFFHFTQKAGFRAAFSAPFPATFHGFSGHTRGDHIDWVLYRGGLRVTGARVHQAPGVFPSAEPVFPSDHFPLVVTFEEG